MSDPQYTPLSVALAGGRATFIPITPARECQVCGRRGYNHPEPGNVCQACRAESERLSKPLDLEAM